MVMIMPRYAAWVLWLSLTLLPCGFPAAAQSQQPPIVPGVKSGLPDAQGTGASTGEQLPDPRLPGSISGTIVDPTRAAVAGARVGSTLVPLMPQIGRAHV